jgi:hypothetical protein
VERAEVIRQGWRRTGNVNVAVEIPDEVAHAGESGI